jgi:hypothetical protein
MSTAVVYGGSSVVISGARNVRVPDETLPDVGGASFYAQFQNQTM